MTSKRDILLNRISGWLKKPGFCPKETALEIRAASQNATEEQLLKICLILRQHMREILLTADSRKVMHAIKQEIAKRETIINKYAV